jgi:small subunit ribosomal protein S21
MDPSWMLLCFQRPSSGAETGLIYGLAHLIIQDRRLKKHPQKEKGCFFISNEIAQRFHFFTKLYWKRDDSMKVIVQDNQIEKAIRDLKKKLTKEGFFSEIKERRFYDKPSVQKKKKQAKAAKRRRKRMRKFS